MKTYFILMESPEPMVKIGRSNNPELRLKSISTSSPFNISLIGTTDIDERKLHRRFAKKRVNREWFTYDSEIEQFIKNPTSEVQKIIKSRNINPWHFAISFIDFYLCRIFKAFRYDNRGYLQGLPYDCTIFGVGENEWAGQAFWSMEITLSDCAEKLLPLFGKRASLKNVANLCQFSKTRIPIELKGRMNGHYGTSDKYHIPEMQKIIEAMLA